MEFKKSVKISKCPQCGGKTFRIDVDPESLDQTDPSEVSDAYECEDCNTVCSDDGNGVRIHFEYSLSEATPVLFGTKVNTQII